MTKGDDTRSTILRQALDLASEVGLEGLTLGALAKRVGMSKSGIYAHFQSKEDLQSQVLDATAAHFVDQVLSPALKKPRGVPRLEALYQRWLDRWIAQISGGCLFIAAATEFDDRPGPVRDALVSHLRDLTGAVARAAQISVEEGNFRKDLDVDQFAFDFWGILLAHHHFHRLMRRADARSWADRAFADLIRRSGSE